MGWMRIARDRIQAKAGRFAEDSEIRSPARRDRVAAGWDLVRVISSAYCEADGLASSVSYRLCLSGFGACLVWQTGWPECEIDPLLPQSKPIGVRWLLRVMGPDWALMPMVPMRLSMGRPGGSYDNALVASIYGMYKRQERRQRRSHEAAFRPGWGVCKRF